MPDLQADHAKICYTVAGILIHDEKVLLIKHKKVGMWLNPGGHVEENETPDQAVVREYFEETGIKVKAISSGPQPASDNVQYLPVPLLINLHWISHENYDYRMGTAPQSEAAARTWSRGCEQHLNFVYLVEAIDDVTFTQNEQETLGIGWFTLAEMDEVETYIDIKQEVALAFNTMGKK